jgi:hypothetical protein
MSEAKSLIIENLVALADTFCAATGQSRAFVSKAIHGRGGQIDDLASGKRDITTRLAEGSLQWFSDNWPADLPWPVHIDRPSPRSSQGDDASPGARTDLAADPLGPVAMEAAE